MGSGVAAHHSHRTVMLKMRSERIEALYNWDWYDIFEGVWSLDLLRESFVQRSFQIIGVLYKIETKRESLEFQKVASFSHPAIVSFLQHFQLYHMG